MASAEHITDFKISPSEPPIPPPLDTNEQDLLNQELLLKHQNLPILEDWIEKKSPTFARGYQKRWVIVRDYNILYSKNKCDIQDLQNEVERKQFLNAIPLIVVQYIIATDPTKSGRKFEIVARDPRTGEKRNYQWRATTHQQCDKWVKGLNEHKQLLIKRLQFLVNNGQNTDLAYSYAPQKHDTFKKMSIATPPPVSHSKQNIMRCMNGKNDMETDIFDQLIMFGYNESDIHNALKNVENKNDINSIREYIDNNYYEIGYMDNEKYAHSMKNNIQQNVVDTMGGDNDMMDEQKNQYVVDEMSGAIKQFYEFLKQHRLEQYFDKFKENECNDIRDIEYLMDDEEFLKNDIGIKSPIHRRRFIGESQKIKGEMNTFKDSNLIPSVLMEKLKAFGIVTMNILCKEIQNKSDLKDKLNINDDKQCDMLWNVIEMQFEPQINILYKEQEGVSNKQNYGNIYNNIVDTPQ